MNLCVLAWHGKFGVNNPGAADGVTATKQNPPIVFFTVNFHYLVIAARMAPTTAGIPQSNGWQVQIFVPATSFFSIPAGVETSATL